MPANISETTEILIKNLYDDIIPTDPQVLKLYFAQLKDIKQLKIIFGVYVGLIKSGLVSPQLLEKSMIDQSINELIDKKYKNRPSIYYDLFCEYGIVLDPLGPER